MANPKHGVLTAATVSTFTLDKDYGSVEVVNRDGVAEVFVSINGATPTVNGDGFHVLPAQIGRWTFPAIGAGSGATTVKLISSGTPKVSVRGV